MQVLCKECGHKARIASRHTMSNTICNLYCQCLDAESCGHTFVMTLAFSHSINPSHAKLQQFFLDTIRAMPAHEQLSLLEQARQHA